MHFDDVAGLLRVLVVGPLAYVWLIVVLQCSGKRTLAQLNAFDFIVTVALGFMLEAVVLSSSVAWSKARSHSASWLPSSSSWRGPQSIFPGCGAP